MDAEPRRPWWRKKRWIAAGLLSLTVSYPLSLGPVMYAAGRGWVGGSVTDPIYDPVVGLLNEVQSAAEDGEVTARAELPDGRIISSRGQSLDVAVPWWAPATSTVARAYWDACVWCGEAGIRHARRAEGR